MVKDVICGGGYKKQIARILVMDKNKNINNYLKKSFNKKTLFLIDIVMYKRYNLGRL